MSTSAGAIRDRNNAIPCSNSSAETKYAGRQVINAVELVLSNSESTSMFSSLTS